MTIEEQISADLAPAMHAGELATGGHVGPPLPAFATGLALGVLAKHIADLHSDITMGKVKGFRGGAERTQAAVSSDTSGSVQVRAAPHRSPIASEIRTYGYCETQCCREQPAATQRKGT